MGEGKKLELKSIKGGKTDEPKSNLDFFRDQIRDYLRELSGGRIYSNDEINYFVRLQKEPDLELRKQLLAEVRAQHPEIKEFFGDFSGNTPKK